MSHRNAILAAVLSFAVSSCGQNSDRADTGEFIDACLASTDQPRPACECIADRAREQLTPGGFTLLVAMLEKDEPAAEALRGRLDMSETIAAGIFMTQAPAACAGHVSAE